MRIALFLLLACGLLAGAAAPFAPGYVAYGLAALALILGIGGLALLQLAVFGPLQALSRDLRALGKGSALPPRHSIRRAAKPCGPDQRAQRRLAT